MLGVMILVAFSKAYYAGMEKQQVKGMKQSLKAAARRNKIEKNVNTLSSSDVTDSLRENGWLR